MEKGNVVVARAGRVKGKKFVVLFIDDYVHIVNGKEYKLSKPKRKNPKHLSFTNQTIDMENITDAGLRRLFHE